jgi:transposase
MSQRTRILTQIAGFRGFKVVDAHWEDAAGQWIEPIAGYDVPPDAVLVLTLARRWAARCGQCLSLCKTCHERRKTRRWKDLPWAGHRVVIEYAPERVKCGRCGSHATELLAWADPKQRQTRRFQQHLALDAFSMPLLHVSTKYGISWHTVRRAEMEAIQRWERTRPSEPLRMVGVDEKYLGRRNKLPHSFVTIVSNLESGEPIWIGYDRSSETLKSWLDTLTPEQKAKIEVFAMDMHEPFRKAVQEDPKLTHADIAHDPFHVMKRAGDAITELRREVFFRAGAQMRAVGRGTRWLVLKAWERTTEEERAALRRPRRPTPSPSTKGHSWRPRGHVLAATLHSP